MSKKKTFVVDTSVILDNIYCIFELYKGENRVIIPETVLDEIDAKKSGFSDVNFQAREFNRVLDKAKTLQEFDIPTPNGVLSSVKVELDGIIVEMISKQDYRVVKHSKENPNIINDRKILEIAQEFPDCTVVSNDIAMRIRARSMKLASEPMQKDRVSDVDDFSFIQEIKIHSSQKEFIKSMKPEDFGIELTIFSNVEFICEDTGEHILCIYKASGFERIDEDKLRALTVKPRNKEQIFFMNMLIDPDIPIVVCAGVTGSGKNLLSLQGGLEFVRDKKNRINSIKYCRNTVTAGDIEAQLGFLKGDEASKLGVFMYPMYDAVAQFQEIAREEGFKQNRAVNITTTEEFIQENNIETININQMRGVNLTGFLVFDEWQNSSASVNKLMMTRVVEGSKVVILGDLNQIDHPHLSKYNNALAIMLKQAKKSDMVGGITMTKVMRGKIAAFADAEL
ncbi:MAG: PhoH family protein [Campylobacterota bacterium]|nr:PhoH family protein [Campylobacterota bacterium]